MRGTDVNKNNTKGDMTMWLGAFVAIKFYWKNTVLLGIHEYVGCHKMLKYQDFQRLDQYEWDIDF